MGFSLYQHGVKPIKTNKVRGSTPLTAEEKHERHKLAQRTYYKERGAFIAYLRRIEKKLDLDKHALKYINTVEELELFSKNYIKTNLDIEVNENSTAYIVYILKKRIS